MTRTPATLSCTACQASNHAHRGYCRACGAQLQPVCRGCLFVNDRGDRYCGGCGSLLESSRPPHDDRALEAGPAVPAAHAAGPAAGLAGLTAASTATPELGELAELLRPLVPAPRDGHLPSSGITQDDLDRLFGGPP